MLNAEQTKKFWSHVRKGLMNNDCWLWTGSRSGKYGVMSINKTLISVHRISYTLKHGPVGKSVFLKRTCKNDFCVNPAHIYKCVKLTRNQSYRKPCLTFNERCKRYNEKYPFKMTERRDRALAEFQLTGM